MEVTQLVASVKRKCLTRCSPLRMAQSLTAQTCAAETHPLYLGHPVFPVFTLHASLPLAFIIAFPISFSDGEKHKKAVASCVHGHVGT